MCLRKNTTFLSPIIIFSFAKNPDFKKQGKCLESFSFDFLHHSWTLLISKSKKVFCHNCFKLGYQVPFFLNIVTFLNCGGLLFISMWRSLKVVWVSFFCLFWVSCVSALFVHFVFVNQSAFFLLLIFSISSANEPLRSLFLLFLFLCWNTPFLVLGGFVVKTILFCWKKSD